MSEEVKIFDPITTEIVENDNESLDATESVENTEDTKKHHCEKCGKSFNYNAGLYNHMRRKHNVIVYTKASIMCREPNCDFRCSMRDKLQAHLVMEHQKPLAFSTLKFSSMKEFDEWKEVFEKQEKCRFVKKSGTRLRSNTGEKHSYLYCSRSGTFVSNSKGKRVQMRKGSCKISNYCTASIDCIEEPNGKVVAKLCSTHYGHEPSVEYLRLTKADKSFIADKLAQGIPRDVLIDNVRASVGENLDRVHFLTMKDIRNIERSYGIKQDSKPKGSGEGFSSVSDWVSDMENLGDESPVVFYKGKNAPKVLSDDCNCLEISDFCLVLMTRGQQEIFKKFGQNGVFYLTWLKVNNGYDLSLLTLMVADDLNEAFPISYMVCSRTTTEIEMLFFKVIRDKLGSFCARAIMTDDRKSLYDSWCSVMGFVPYHLLSNRFVDADWRDRLITVQNEDVQCAVYEVLYSYLSCTDSSKFEDNLQAFIKHLKENSDTMIFGLYFEDNYLHRVRLWAGCYDKKSVGVNEHLNLDIVYNEILTVCNLKGKFSKMMDKTLQGLLTIVRDRQHNRILKITKQVQELSHHHGISKNISLEGISEIENRKWQIKSESSNLTFTVTRKTYECSIKCALVCSLCKVCAHMFECSCKVYNFDRTMCKHIHAIGRLFQKSLNVLDFWDSGSQVCRGLKGESSETKSDITVKAISDVNNEDENNEKGDKTEKTADIKKGPFIVVAQQKYTKVGSFGNRIRKILQSLADDVSDVTDPVMLRKIFIKLKKVKNFVTGKSKAEESETNTPEKKKRGRPSKVNSEVKRAPLVKRPPGRPRKVHFTEDEEKEKHVGPRNLQEIFEEQLLEEKLINEEVEKAHETPETAKANETDKECSSIDNVSETNEANSSSAKGKPQEIVKVPKKRGRKPKPKNDQEVENDEDYKAPIDPKKRKVQVSTETEKDASDVIATRKSTREIKKKVFDYFETDEVETKKKISKRSSGKAIKIEEEGEDEEEIKIKQRRVKRVTKDVTNSEEPENNKSDKKGKNKVVKDKEVDGEKDEEIGGDKDVEIDGEKGGEKNKEIDCEKDREIDGEKGTNELEKTIKKDDNIKVENNEENTGKKQIKQAKTKIVKVDKSGQNQSNGVVADKNSDTIQNSSEENPNINKDKEPGTDTA